MVGPGGVRPRGTDVAVLCLVLTFAIAGCIGDGGWARTSLIQTGSSTVLPLAEAWAYHFEGAHVAVSGGGSSHGLNALLTGQADLADASRLLKGSDYEKVGGDPGLVQADGTVTGPAPSGVVPTKWVVAYDVLAVIVNERNDWAAALNYSQLYSIFTDDSPAGFWDEVPGLDAAPHERIEIFAPDEASGTFDYFFESIVPDWGKETQAARPRLERDDGVYHPSADDNIIMNAVRDQRYAIGYLGFAYVLENPGAVAPVMLARGDESPVAPSFANVSSYPMARPLHIYTDGVPSPESERGAAVHDYLAFVLGEDGQAIVPELGYVRLSLVDPSLVTSQLARLDEG